MELRQPIITVLGHTDAGKTTLLDGIRGTSVQLKEAGGITQSIGASIILKETIEKICHKLLDRFKVKLVIPGLLFIDTPGHEAFMSLRKRGGSVADLAILVIDIFKGFKPQTDESLAYLNQFKVPFIVAATKIDLIDGWINTGNLSFFEAIDKQPEPVRQELEKKLWEMMAGFAERGYEAEILAKIKDFKSQIPIVPCSGKTKEGIAELLLALAGLAQVYLKDRLKLSGTTKGIVLEVKKLEQLGKVIDCILYDGQLKVGDWLVIGGRKPIITKVRALLLPEPLRELRVEKSFKYVEKVKAAVGVRILAPNLEQVVAGNPFLAVKTENEVEKAKELVLKELELVEFKKDIEGVIARASTLGGLEALINMLRRAGIPIRKAEVGGIINEDFIELELVKEKAYKAILLFNLQASEEELKLGKAKGIEIFQSDVIYRLMESYGTWVKQLKEKEAEAELASITRPVKLKVLPGYIFRRSKPAIFGVHVLEGCLSKNSLLKRKDGKILGKVMDIQKEGKSIPLAFQGESVAISMEKVVIGKNLNEGDELLAELSQKDVEILKKHLNRLSESERKLLETIA